MAEVSGMCENSTRALSMAQSLPGGGPAEGLTDATSNFGVDDAGCAKAAAKDDTKQQRSSWRSSASRAACAWRRLHWQVMGFTLTADMKAVIQSAHLCFAATVTPEGRPNLSPKGTVRVWDESSIFFLDIASPRTRANLAVNPAMELNVVEQLSRRGYRFSGRASVHFEGAVFDRAKALVMADEKSYAVTSVIVLDVEQAAPLLSPGYWKIGDEREMRALWRQRRAELDREFEAHLEKQGFLKVEG